jgi:hypothetical protein
MNEQQLAAVKQALEAFSVLSMNDYSGYECSKHEADKIDEAVTALQSIISQDALDWMAKNARELGLDYEPAVQEPVDMYRDKCADGSRCLHGCHTNEPCYTTPPTAQPAVQEGRDWSLLEATQESLREHMAEIKRLKAAQPAPVQEPVAWMVNGSMVVREDWIERLHWPFEWVGAGRAVPDSWTPILYATPPTAQLVPVKTYSGGKPWPVAPKPWVGLTDEEMEDLWAIHSGLPLYRAIEQRLKEKNHD